MQIKPCTPDQNRYRRYSDGLTELLSLHGDQDRGPDGALANAPSKPKVPLDCNCPTFPKCQHAQAALSSDGARFPIEANIVPLVYAMHGIEDVETCWSCGGHEDDKGELTRVPRVVFYLRSGIFSSVLAEFVADLRFRQRLNYPWHVVVTPMGNKIDVSYTLQPNLEGENAANLGLLQKDVEIIAGALRSGVAETARSFLDQMRKTLNPASSLV